MSAGKRKREKSPKRALVLRSHINSLWLRAQLEGGDGIDVQIPRKFVGKLIGKTIEVKPINEPGMERKYQLA